MADERGRHLVIVERADRLERRCHEYEDRIAELEEQLEEARAA